MHLCLKQVFSHKLNDIECEMEMFAERVGVRAWVFAYLGSFSGSCHVVISLV